MGKTYGQFSVQNRQGRHFWSDINLAFSSNFDVQPHQNDQLVETTQTMPKVIFLPFSFWLLTVKNQKLNGRKGWVKIWPFFCSEASHRQHCAHGLKTAPMSRPSPQSIAQNRVCKLVRGLNPLNENEKVWNCVALFNLQI